VAALVPTAFVPNSAASAPIGSIAGYLTADPTLGLLNGPCSTVLLVAFSLMVASTNRSDTVAPKPVGQSNPAEPLAVDVNPANGIPDGADKYPAYLNTFFKEAQPRARLFGVSKIQGGWVTLNFMFFDAGARVQTTAGTDTTFDPALGLPSITVLGDPSVPPSPGAVSDFCAPLRSENVTLGKTYNNPCTPLPSPAGANCPGPIVRENSGIPMLPCDTGNSYDEDGDGKVNDGCPQVLAVAESGAQCDNNTSDDGEDSSVNDGCAPVGDQEATRIGACSGTDEGACVVRQNPAAPGPYTFNIVAASQRDADSDGLENSLDVCALDFNPDWNPHILTTPANLNEDDDGDGLPNVCDPAPNTKSGISPTGCSAGIVGDDEDKDCFANRADNCPNDKQLKDNNAPPDATVNTPDIVDGDYDGIGDACDPNPTVVNGEFQGFCIEFTLDVGAPAVAETGTRDPVGAPECAGQSTIQQPITQTPPAATATPFGQTPKPTVVACTGVNCGDGTGVGSLSPTNAGIPIWAAVMAALGGVGLLIGAGMLRLGHAKRRIE
jgi:hypothetical protein